LVTPAISSVAVNVEVTVAAAPVTLIDVGANVNAVSRGAVESVVEVTDNVGVSPLAASPVLSRSNVLPAASATKTEVTVHVPASLKRGNVIAAEPVFEVAAAKVAVPTWLVLPEGASRTTWKKFAPARSSLTVKFTFTFADAAVVSIEAGVIDKALILGGVLSTADDTSRAVGKPRAATPALSRKSVLPAESARKMYATFQVPCGLNCGKVTTAESVIDVLGGLKTLKVR